MKDALLVCDNRDVLNWGCRATSIALHRLLKDRFGVSGRIGRLDVLRKETASPRLAQAAMRFGGNGIGKAILASLIRRTDYITGDIEGSARTVLSQRSVNLFFESLAASVERSGLVVVNGEGSMVFKPTERRDLRFQLLCLELGRQLGKPTFYVNAMISDFPGSPRPAQTWEKCRAQLAQCGAVQVRDRESFALLEAMDTGTRIAALPDALFSAGDLFTSFLLGDVPARALAPFPEHPDRIDWTFDAPYICVGGSSYFRARGRFAEARALFPALAARIRKLGFHPVFVATCTGDAFLEPLAREAGAGFIPVETNIFVGAAILGNAAAFVSGRYHPSILAMLGGTPCVAFESNSHKMASLQQWLGRSGDELAYRDAHVLDLVEERLAAIVSSGSGMRQDLRTRAQELGRLAATIPDVIDPPGLEKARAGA